MAPRPLKLAILGATGAVGRTLLEVLEEHDFPVALLRLLASQRSVGSHLEFQGEELEVEALKEGAFRGQDLAIFAAEARLSREWSSKAWAEGCAVIDTSSAFDRDGEVPLVVPEINPGDVAGYRTRGVVASPSGPAIPLAVALAPLHTAAGIDRLVVSTYQSVSGAGHTAVVQMEREVRALMSGIEPEPAEQRIPHRIAFNLVPQVGAFSAGGYTDEEIQTARQVQRLLGPAAPRVSVTAVRVPVFYGYGQSVNLTMRRKLTAAEARELLRKAPGVKLVDDPEQGIYPMPMLAVNDDAVLVGRVREDRSQENGLTLFLAADNLRKGAATNAVQIARLLQERYL